MGGFVQAQAPAPPSSAQFLQGAAQSFANVLANQRAIAANKVAQQEADTQVEAQKTNQQRTEDEAAYHKDYIKQENARMQLMLKLQGAMHNLQAQTAITEAQKQTTATGVPPPNAQQIGQNVMPYLPGVNFGPATLSKTYSIPNMFLDEQGNPKPGTFTAPNPILAAQQQAKLTGIEQAPIVSGKIAETQAQAQAQGYNQAILEQMRAKNALDVEKMRADSSTVDARIRASAELGAAATGAQGRITAAGVSAGALIPSAGGGTQPVDITTALKQIAAGNLSEGDLSKLGAQGKYIQSTALRAGLITPDDKQKEFIRGAAPIGNTINLMQEWNDLWQGNPQKGIPATPTSVLLDPTSPLNQHLHVLQSEINSGLANSIKTFTSGGRMNKAQIEAMEKAYGPELLKKGPIDNAKMEQFRQLFTNTVRGNLYNLPSEQQSTIMQNMFNTSQGPKYGTLNGQKVISYDNGQTAYYLSSGQKAQ